MIGLIATKFVVYTTTATIRFADYLHRIEQISPAEGPFSVVLFSASSYSARFIHVWAFFEHLTCCAKRK
jgi:hypothetical protein